MTHRERLAMILPILLLLVSFNVNAQMKICPKDMVSVGSWCVDQYKASVNASSDCSGKWINQDIDSLASEANGIRKNGEIIGKGAFACSVKTVLPARWITWFQASTLCALSGKELIPDKVWITAAIGTPKEKCTTSSSGPALPNPQCQSQWGAIDMVGNLWEWTDAWFVTGRIGIERNGKPFEPASQKDNVWPADYCGSKGSCPDTVWGVNGEAGSGTQGLVEGLPAATLRGGNYKMKEAAGVYAMSLNAAPSHFRETTGFRCAVRK